MLPDEKKEESRPKPTPNPNDSLYNTGADFGAQPGQPDDWSVTHALFRVLMQSSMR